MDTPPPSSAMPPPFSATPPPVINAPPAIASRNGSDKLWSVLCHLSSFIGIGYFILPLVVYLVMKEESEYVRANAREALNFHISVFLYWLCCVPLVFLFGLGVLLAIGITIAFLILSIVAAVKAADGGCYHYPLTIRLIQ